MDIDQIYGFINKLDEHGVKTVNVNIEEETHKERRELEQALLSKRFSVAYVTLDNLEFIRVDWSHL